MTREQACRRRHVEQVAAALFEHVWTATGSPGASTCLPGTRGSHGRDVGRPLPPLPPQIVLHQVRPRGRSNMRVPGITPVGAVVRGLGAGAVGTLAMDLLLFARYKRGDGKSSFRRGSCRRRSRAGTRHRHRHRSADAWSRACSRGPCPTGWPRWSTTSHLGLLGIVNGVPYGLVVGSLPRPRVWFGVPFGAGVWGSSTSSCRRPGCTGRSGSTTAARSRTTSAPTSSTASPLLRPSGCCPTDGRGRRDLGPDSARRGLTPRGSARADDVTASPTSTPECSERGDRSDVRAVGDQRGPQVVVGVRGRHAER